jgi:hypothetical protein
VLEGFDPLGVSHLKSGLLPIFWRRPTMPFTGKLGKQPPKKDPRTLQLATYFTKALKPPPASVDYSKNIPIWPMYLNDRIGDCTVAYVGHQVQAWTTLSRNHDVMITDDQVLHAYEAIAGYDPAKPATDQGAYEADVLKYWRGTGIGGRKITAWADVLPMSAVNVRQAVFLFGGLFLGLAMPTTAQSQIVWDVVDKAFRGDSAPGSWGGHAVNVVGYDDKYVYVITWGAVKAMTWAFFKAYCDEAHAVLSWDWLKPVGWAPIGFNLTQLMADLRVVTGA